MSTTKKAVPVGGVLFGIRRLCLGIVVLAVPLGAPAAGYAEADGGFSICCDLETGECFEAGEAAGYCEHAGQSNTCRPQGACLLADGGCVETIEECCLVAGGEYIRDGFRCDYDFIGACCLDDRTCEIMSEQDCADLLGEFKGVGQSCTPSPCLDSNGFALQIVTPGYDYEDQWSGEFEVVDHALASDPAPFVELSGITEADVSVSTDGWVTVELSGVVRDYLADIALDQTADIESVTIRANGTDLQTILIDRDFAYEQQHRSLLRPYAYQSLPFHATVRFTGRAGRNLIVVESSENAAGNAGFDTIVIDLDAQYEYQEGGGEPVKGDLQYYVHVDEGLDPSRADRITFHFGTFGAEKIALEETGPASRWFAGTVPGIGGIEIGLEQFDYFDPLVVDHGLVEVVITQKNGNEWGLEGRLAETTPDSGVLRWSNILPTANLSTVTGLRADWPANAAADSTDREVTFYVSMLDEEHFAAALPETAAGSSVFAGDVEGLGYVWWQFDDVQETVGESFPGSANGTMEIEFPDGELMWVEGVFPETGVQTNEFEAPFQTALDGNVGPVSVPHVVLADVQDGEGNGGGPFTPLLVWVEAPEGPLADLLGEYSDTARDWDVVSTEVGAGPALFFGISDAATFGEEAGAPVLFAELVKKKLGVTAENIEQKVGRADAKLKRGGATVAEQISSILKVELKFFHKDPGFGANPDNDFADEDKVHKWSDVKLVDIDHPADSKDDKILWAGVRVAGVKALETVGSRPPTISLNKFPIRLYNICTVDPADSTKDISTGMFLLTVGIEEPEFVDHFLDLASYDPTGGVAFFKGRLDLGALDLLANQTDEAVNEFAVMDHDAVETQEGNEADGFVFAQFLKKRGFVSRGLAHPKPGSRASDYLVKKDARTAGGDERWGRPVANAEFIASGGVEKVVATALARGGKRDRHWLRPGERPEMDHALIKSPADVFYMSGHGHEGTFYSSSLDKVVDVQDKDRAINVTKFWNPGDDAGKFELEWLIVVGCNLLNDQNDHTRQDTFAYRWAKAMLHDKRLQGMLGFSEYGWTGEDWMSFFEQASKHNIEYRLSAAAAGGDTSIKLQGDAMKEVIGDVPIGEVLDGGVKLGDELKIGSEKVRVKKVGDESLKLASALAGAHARDAVVTVQGTITRAWRAYMRHKKALATKLIKGGDDGIDAKEPAYCVYERFHDKVFLDNELAGGLLDTDGTPGQNVIYWEAGKVQAATGRFERLRGVPEKKKQEPERLIERTFP